jgi:hypothetical protein
MARRKRALGGMPFVACEDATKKDVRDAEREVRALRKLYSRIPSSELEHEIKTAERHALHLFRCVNDWRK